MTALLIGERERAAIAELRSVAAASPFEAFAAAKAAEMDSDAFRSMMRMFTVELPLNYFVTYTHEYQPHAPPPGLCHHISISVNHVGHLPSVAAVEMILVEFGMLTLADSNGVWVEHVSPTEKAVNVVQLVARS